MKHDDESSTHYTGVIQAANSASDDKACCRGCGAANCRTEFEDADEGQKNLFLANEACILGRGRA